MDNTNSNRYFIAWTQYLKINWLLNIYLLILVNVASAPARHNQLKSKLQIQLLMQLLSQKSTQVQSYRQHQLQRVFYRLK